MPPHQYCTTGGGSLAVQLNPENMSLPEVSAQVALVEPVMPWELVCHLQREAAFERPELDSSTFKPPPHF
eukprot:6475071-Amphidinium_carterae.1